jgi:hypothetical protein
VRLATVLFAAFALLAGSGCGSRAQSSRPEAPPPSLATAGDTVGVIPKETLAVGQGDRRVVLVATKGNGGQLCISAKTGHKQTDLRCLGPGLPDPAVAFVGIGGKSPKDVEWASLIGLAREDVERVSVQMQTGRPLRPKLRRWPGFKWSLFSLEPGAGGTFSSDAIGTMEINRPNELIGTDAKGWTLIDLSLGWVYGPCESDAPCPSGTGRWADVQDPFIGASYADSESSAKAKAVALRDPLVRRLLAGRRYWFGPSSAWDDCEGSPLGAGFEVHVADPIDYEGDFPTVAFDRQADEPYAEGVWHLAFSNASLIDLTVDLRRRRVVDVDPTLSDNVEIDQGRSHWVKEPEVEDIDCDGNPDPARRVSRT